MAKIKEEKKVIREENIEMSVLQRELSSFTRSGHVVDIYREHLVRESLFGRLIQWSDVVIVFEKLDELYEYDGISIIRTGDLTRMRAYDRELMSIQKLLSHEKPEPLHDVAGVAITTAVTKLSQKFNCLAFYTERIASDMVFVGVPESLDDDFLAIRAWGTARNGDEYRLILKITEITRVDANSKYLRTLESARKVQGFAG